MNDDVVAIARAITQDAAFTDDDAIIVAREYLFLVTEQRVMGDALALLDKKLGKDPLAAAEGGDVVREPAPPPDLGQSWTCDCGLTYDGDSGICMNPRHDEDAAALRPRLRIVH